MQSVPLVVPMLLFTVLASAACGDVPDHPAAPQREHVVLSGQSQAHPAAAMRIELRGMDDRSLVERVTRSRNIVVVGFREPGALWGVDARGRSLVPRALAAQRVRELAALPGVARIDYEFHDIPAVVVELRTPQAALGIRKLPWVDYVTFNSNQLTPDAAEAASGTSNQPIPWNITRVRADEAWSIATGNIPGVLSVLDDGADEGNGPSPGADTGDWYIYLWWYTDRGWNREGSHGTAVLAAAKARNNAVGTVGVAPDAMATIDVIIDPIEGVAWESHAAKAVDYESRYSGARVMTISYSTKQTEAGPPASQTALYDAIRAAYYQRGVLFTASTGNQSEPLYAYPARFAEVIGVGGSGYGDEWVFNNWAPGNVEIAAPAVDVGVIGKGGVTTTASGTSYATPMVAGALMLLRQRFPDISNDSIRARLRNSAVPMAEPLKSGAGRMDVYRALTLGESNVYELPPCDPAVERVCPT